MATNDRTAIQAAIKRATGVAHRDVEALDARAATELRDLYRTAASDIAERIRLYGAGGDSITLAELRSILEQVNARIAELTAVRNSLLSGTLRSASDLGVRPYGLDAAAAMESSARALRAVRSFIGADGLQLSDRIWRIDRATRDRVVNAIESAVIQGQGAAQAAVEFMRAGQAPPAELGTKMDQARPGAVAKAAYAAIMEGDQTPMQNALRVFRTEINRAHGEAYMQTGEDRPDFGGWRYLLSPAHPGPDICDLLSTQNLYGLGNGVYPTREKTPWPAHPNTLSFIEIVFADEITAADRAGKETPLQALDRLTPDQRKGALGVGKSAIHDEGQLTAGMIRSPLSVVQKRIGGAKFSIGAKK